MNDLEAVRYASRMCGYPSTSSECLNRGESTTWDLPDAGVVARVSTRDQAANIGRMRTISDAVALVGIPTPRFLESVTIESDPPMIVLFVRRFATVPRPKKTRMFLMGEVIRHLHESAPTSGHECQWISRKDAQLDRFRQVRGKREHEWISTRWDDASAPFRSMTPDVFVHGDPHLGNVLVGSSHACLIDWEDAGWGDRMVDLARVATALNRTEEFSDAHRGAFWDGYGWHVEVPESATRMHDVARLIWAGSLEGDPPGGGLGYEASKRTLDDPTAVWYPSSGVA